ncbi:MAG TPA: PadR family transcriptional regulator [Vicinamibacterales bacterium]|nr:PadR family transcriptional regulator [Vicinamibacterales bacterium]
MEKKARPRTDPRPFLPLTHLAYHILLSLAEAPAHGYALVQRIRKRSEGLVDPGTGSFYSIIKKLSDDDLIAETETDDGDGRRRWYGITPLGKIVLAAEAERLSAQLAATRKLGLASGGRGGAR